MKKVLLILFAILLMSPKCNETIIIPPEPLQNTYYVIDEIYEKNQKDEAIKILYEHIKFLDFDSIPIEKWQLHMLNGNPWDVTQYISYGELDSLIFIFNYGIFSSKYDTLYWVRIRREIK